MKKTFFFLLAIIVFPLNAQAAELYRWVDADGKVHYTDTRPPSDARDARVTRVPQQAVAPEETQASATTSYATQQAATNFPVTLYTSPSCADYCENARKLLNQRGIPFTEKQLQTEEERSAFLQLFNDQDMLPSATVGSRQLSGYEVNMWNALLDKVGYPAAPAPSQTP